MIGRSGTTAEDEPPSREVPLRYQPLSYFVLYSSDLMKGRAGSSFSLRERRERAYEMFAKGNRVSQVAKKLGVRWDTAKRYEKEYQVGLRSEAGKNPQMLQNVLENTIRTLEELDIVRRQAWADYEKCTSKQTRALFLNTVLRAQAQRNQLFGLIGVRQEYVLTINNVRIVQDRLLEFMSKHLCEKDKEKLERFMLEDLKDYLDERPPVIPAEIVSVS